MQVLHSQHYQPATYSKTASSSAHKSIRA
jgi:hypothetical protein